MALSNLRAFFKARSTQTLLFPLNGVYATKRLIYR